MSIYWHFIPKQWYYSPHFLTFSSYSMIFLNLYQLFVRKRALARCLENMNPMIEVCNTLFKKHDRNDIKFTVECLIICNMCCIIMTPGAHFQL